MARAPPPAKKDPSPDLLSRAQSRESAFVSDAMRAFKTFLGHSDMMAYLAMMSPRLIELRFRRLLRLQAARNDNRLETP